MIIFSRCCFLNKQLKFVAQNMATSFEKCENSLNINPDVSCHRAPYRSSQDTLNEQELDKNPFRLFKEWFENARQCSQIEEPNAMCLATANKNGFPSARYVLLKHFDQNGFVFFTNYDSRKGKEMEENPQVATVFYWGPLRRSVRIEGVISKIAEKNSSEYFNSRPKDSQIGACVSKQSSVIPNRKLLEDEMQRLQEVYRNETIPRPQNWGGYLIAPRKIEFWQGQNNRLHDRIVFRKPAQDEKPDEVLTHAADDGWVYERLSP